MLAMARSWAAETFRPRTFAEDVLLAEPGDEQAGELGEGDATAAMVPVWMTRKGRPAVEEADERAVGLAQVDVEPAGVGHHPGQLAVAQGADDRDDAR